MHHNLWQIFREMENASVPNFCWYLVIILHNLDGVLNLGKQYNITFPQPYKIDSKLDWTFSLAKNFRVKMLKKCWNVICFADLASFKSLRKLKKLILTEYYRLLEVCNVITFIVLYVGGVIYFIVRRISISDWLLLSRLFSQKHFNLNPSYQLAQVKI